MKISVLIPSRGRVRQLAAALTSLWLCQSGEHEVKYCVACDDDDPETFEFLKKSAQEMPIAVRHGPRPDSLGSVASDLAEHWPADAYLVWGDDILCVGYGWDADIARAIEKTPHGVFFWRSARDEYALIPVISEKWRAAAGGIFTDLFPFWYDDLWLYELWIMATDADPIELPCAFVDKPQSTIRMRELDFWNEFYLFMRHERVRRGKEIAKNLGLPEPVIGPMLAERLAIIGRMPAEEVADVERRNKADTGPPGEAYTRAKERAMALLKAA